MFRPDALGSLASRKQIKEAYCSFVAFDWEVNAETHDAAMPNSPSSGFVRHVLEFIDQIEGLAG